MDMFRRLALQRREEARFASPHNSGGDLALGATLILFGVLPIGAVSTMMLMQIFGVWSP
jgi:hypothetical protein